MKTSIEFRNFITKNVSQTDFCHRANGQFGMINLYKITSKHPLGWPKQCVFTKWNLNLFTEYFSVPTWIRCTFDNMFVFNVRVVRFSLEQYLDQASFSLVIKWDYRSWEFKRAPNVKAFKIKSRSLEKFM